MEREEIIAMMDGALIVINKTAKPLEVQIKQLEAELKQTLASVSTLEINTNVLLTALNKQGVAVRPSANVNGIWQDIEIEITNNKKEQ